MKLNHRLFYGLVNMKVAIAAYDTVHDHTGSLEALSNALGIRSAQVLRNKVNLNEEKTHHLSLREAQLLIKATGNHRILEALADDIGGIFIPLPKHGSANMLSAVNNISAMSKEFGALIEEVAGDLADGMITTTEFKRIEKEAGKLRLALSVMIADLSAIYKDGQAKKPKQPT